MLQSYNTNYNLTGNNQWIQGTLNTTDATIFNSITMSSSGQYLAACGNSNIFTSNNYGVNWTRGPTISVSSITSSSSGQYLAALFTSAGGVTSVYTSSNYGIGWTNENTLSNCYGNKIVSSSSGQYLAICGTNGVINLSYNYGVTWIIQFPPSTLRTLSSICMSSSGQYIFTCSNNALGGSYIIGSSNFGLNWQVLNGNGLNWSVITSSSNGQYVAAAFHTTSAVPPTPESGVYTSNNYGVTWTYQPNSPNNKSPSSFTSSGSGQTIALCQSISSPDPSGCVFISNDYGVTWNTNPQLVITSYWYGIVVSTSGQYLAVCSNSNTGIYTYSNNVDIGTMFCSMIEELQISQTNKLIYPSTYFYWSTFLNLGLSGYYGYASNQFVTGTLQGAAQVATNQNGIYLVNQVAKSSGSIYWNIPNFDYNQNFEVIATCITGGPGYGLNLCIGIGCSYAPTAINGTSQYTQLGRGLWCVYDTLNNTTFFSVSASTGAKVGGNSVVPLGLSYLSTGIVNCMSTIKITVITIAGLRIANIYLNGILQNSVNLALNIPFSWNDGTYLIIGAASYNSVNLFTCSSVQLNYI